MASFESELKKSSGPPQPTLSSLSSEFELFREFVLATLKNLELQVSVLISECDDMEMRSRRAMLLLHGVPESKDESPAESILKVASQHLAVVKLCEADIVRASRLGKTRTDKPRPLLIKFRSESQRDSLWAAKSGLKGSGVTVSEFLTKLRHKVFVAARERLGVAKCWTSAGRILALDNDGRRHRVSSMADVEQLFASSSGSTSASTGTTTSRRDLPPSAPSTRNRRAASAKRN